MPTYGYNCTNTTFACVCLWHHSNTHAGPPEATSLPPRYIKYIRSTQWVGTKPLMCPAAVQFSLYFLFFISWMTFKNCSTSTEGLKNPKRPSRCFRLRLRVCTSSPLEFQFTWPGPGAFLNEPQVDPVLLQENSNCHKGLPRVPFSFLLRFIPYFYRVPVDYFQDVARHLHKVCLFTRERVHSISQCWVYSPSLLLLSLKYRRGHGSLSPCARWVGV